MTQTDKASMTFGSQTSSGQMNGHTVTGTESRNSEELSPNSISPTGRPESSSESVLTMGSTDSAGNAHGSGSSCGLVSSLFPSSCRGRAEAFARRLHRRLTSLGGENNGQVDTDLTKPTETSWLHSNSGIRTTPPTTSSNLYHDQQQQLSHSSESDLYYDLSLDLDEDDGPSSPAEEATAAELADLLVNSNVLKSKELNGSSQDSGTNGIFSTPVIGNTPENDESEIYFDPVSSDSDKKTEIYFDPVTTSDSDSSPHVSNGLNGFPSFCENNTFHDRTGSKEESSESNCLLRRDIITGKSLSIASSDTSTNTKSSVDTTSHESLWSTFDESTVSLQDDSPAKLEYNSDGISNRLLKSFSDSELSINNIDDISELVRENGDVDEVDFVTEGSQNGLNDDNFPKVAQFEETDTDTDNSTYSSSINIPGDLIRECPLASMKNEVKLQIEDGGLTNGPNEEEITRLLEKLGHNCTDKTEEIIKSKDSPDEQENKDEQKKEEEEEEEEQRLPRIRRCSSLKTGKTPPGTPGHKKIVRFADVLGLDLADVRTFLDEIPKIPNSAYSDLFYDEIFQKDSSPVSCGIQSWSARYMDHRSTDSTLASQKLDRTLVPLFQQPGSLASFLDIVRERLVCLENAIIQDPVNLYIKGTVRVLNLDFHKSVHIRYTLNSWRNYSDLQATYVPNSCDGFSDKFSFALYCHTLRVGQKLEFAVRFHCKGMQYWDNNSGANYCFQCLPTRFSSSYIPITTSETAQDWAPMFY